VVLVTDEGEEVLRTGDAAGFKAGDTNGHCLRNNSNSEVYVLEVGTRVTDDSAHYSDMLTPAGGNPAIYTHHDGTRMPTPSVAAQRQIKHNFQIGVLPKK